MQGIDILLPAFVVCVLMLLTHCYFGLHVLSRGIIFVDLALAQVAALGISVAFLLGKETHSPSAILYAFLATLIASLLLAKLRLLSDKVSREVAIGCVYVVATALTIVILSRSVQGMEELKSILNGNILWVSWQEISVLVIAYLLVSVFHVIFRRKFYQLSFNEKKQSNGFVWEFLFFATFAVIITLAVNIAGILLVFAFLIIPAFSASLLTQTFIKQLLFAWVLGLGGSMLGLLTAYHSDLPVGATIVSFVGIIPVLIGIYIYVVGKKNNRTA